MARIQLDDFYPGLVAYLDAEVLNTTSSVRKPSELVPRAGPFLCIQASEQRSTWVPITSCLEADFEQHEIPMASRKFGSARWRNGRQCVRVPVESYEGPNLAFVRARCPTRHDSNGYEHPCVCLDEVASIRRLLTA